jgi:hypothetical protein
VKGSGYIHISEEGKTVAYSHFTLLEVTNVSGELISEDSHGINEWIADPDFGSPEMIPSMSALAKALESPELFFLDLNYNLT